MTPQQADRWEPPPNSMHVARAAYANARVLLTGGTGYVGSRLFRALETLGCDITLLVRDASTVDDRLHPQRRPRIVSADIQARGAWADGLNGIDYVFHLAAQTSARAAHEDPLSDLNINVRPILHMLEECAARQIPARILFAGTVTEVGLTTDSSPVNESRADRPVTVYDIHKLTAEHYLRVYAGIGLVQAVTLRLANVYGPGPASGQADRGVLNQMIRGALCGKPIVLHGSGAFVRDYIFIDDVVSAFVMAGAMIGDISGRAYVIGSGAGTRLVDAAHLIADCVESHTGFRPPVLHAEPPAGQVAIDQRSFVADTTRFSGATGWQTGVSLKDGIDRTIDTIRGLTLRNQAAR